MASNGKPAPKMVKLTINGQEIEVREGTNLVDAAEQLGIEVPHYCYHPGLSIPANCRICQCEVEGAPKLVFGCRTPAKDGMVVHTDSPKAKAAQQLVQEFLLCNHPLDCPICDKSGECTLQNYYMEYGQYQPVMIENKYKKHKATPIGPTIVLDTERCILCSRCVRFCDEVTGTSELGLFNRNNHTEIGVVPGQALDNPYSGNLVDICPVGALGDRDFRFKCRVWYLQHTESICPGCAKGCNITVDWQTRRRHIAGGARIMRLRPRFHEEVNGHWMCDDGRYGYGWHDENRVTACAVKTAGVQSEVLPREAFDAAVARFLAVDRQAWTVVVSTFLSNEELFLARTLFAEGLGVRVAVGPPPVGVEDALLRRADKSPNTAG
ncbi:MAG: (2Fe-2S)-binding protein, partial [Candidatus Sumerlaeia bacterium]|nr:(2Fe-2S)-binding protein [Candidatus Sumerlaeia bacterium]